MINSILSKSYDCMCRQKSKLKIDRNSIMRSFGMTIVHVQAHTFCECVLERNNNGYNQ